MPQASPTSPFDAAFERLILVEGGYSNHSSDPGGRTMYGITEAVARQHGYHGPMRSLALADAKRIYRRAYWDACRCDDLAATAGAPVADEVFDSAVNCGVGRAARWLQEALNALNARGRLYANVAEDGQVGPGTLSALRAYVGRRRGIEGMTVLLRALNVLQGAHYLRLASDDAQFEDFLYGWLRTRVSVPTDRTEAVRR